MDQILLKNSQKTTGTFLFKMASILLFLFGISTVGQAQNALNFDGVDDQVSTQEIIPISGTQARTVEAWIRTSASGDQVIAMWGVGETGKKFTVRLDGEYLRIESENGPSIATGTILNDGAWHHIAVVLPEGGISVDDIIMYVDGEVEPHPGHFRIFETVESPLIVGNSSVNPDRLFNGDIEELRVWNVERSAEDIARYMNQELCDNTGLVVRFSFDEGESEGDNTGLSSTTDAATGNNGLLENFSLNSSSSNFVDGLIPEVNTGTDTQIRCVGDSFTWIDGVTYTESNNTATFNIVGGGSNTCDSLVLLDLSMVEPDNTLSIEGATISSNQSGAEYQWVSCPDMIAIDNANDQSYEPEENGSYAVEITMGGCMITSECLVVTTVGVDDKTAFDQIKIYPNPNRGTLFIEKGDLAVIDVQIVDIVGKVIATHNNISTPRFKLDLEAPQGIYIIEVSSQGEKRQYRLVKHN